jgi:hypothetical protein
MARFLAANRRRRLLDALPLGFESDFQQLFDCISARGDSRLHPAPTFDCPQTQMNGSDRIISHDGVSR